MQVYRLPVLTDNYVFVLHDPQRHLAAVIDPAVAVPVLQCLQNLKADLIAIFNTHHHSDHVGGNRELLHQFPQAVVYGGAIDRGRIPVQQVFLQAGDRVEFGDRVAEVFFVPGHTKAHIAYYFLPTATEGGELFCGDTLFAGGCGRLFEGTPAQMVDSLTKLRSLPDDTRVWCAHEYTLNNLRFALTVDPDNSQLRSRYQQAEILRRQNEATVPTSIAVEKQTNPFLRCDQPALRSPDEDEVKTFARLRRLKDQF